MTRTNREMVQIFLRFHGLVSLRVGPWMVVFPNRSGPDILCFWPQRLLRLTTRFTISRFGGFDVVFSYRSAPEIFVFAPSVFSLLLHAPNCLWIHALAPSNSNAPSAASAFASFHALIRGTFATLGIYFPS
jgi:hypothetical protein